MPEILTYLLPVYFTAYFAITFIVKSLLVLKKTGSNPLVFPDDDSPHALVGFYFKIIVLFVFIYVYSYSLFPGLEMNLCPITLPHQLLFIYIGMTLLAAGFMITVAAQQTMKGSWRIGIDSNSPTPLVTNGIFRLSRNPVFLGMMLNIAGLFLLTPNAATLIFLIVFWLLIQIQIRLEEEFLLKLHGELYIRYRKHVRRWI